MTMTLGAKRLTAGQVRRILDPSTLPFLSTVEIDPASSTIRQPRALDAIDSASR